MSNAWTRIPHVLRYCCQSQVAPTIVSHHLWPMLVLCCSSKHTLYWHWCLTLCDTHAAQWKHGHSLDFGAAIAVAADGCHTLQRDILTTYCTVCQNWIGDTNNMWSEAASSSPVTPVAFALARISMTEVVGIVPCWEDGNGFTAQLANDTDTATQLHCNLSDKLNQLYAK